MVAVAAERAVTGTEEGAARLGELLDEVTVENRMDIGPPAVLLPCSAHGASTHEAGRRSLGPMTSTGDRFH